MTCPFCESDNVTQTTPCDEYGQQEYQCNDCSEYFTDKCEDLNLENTTLQIDIIESDGEMKKIYIAKFEYGRPKLAVANIVKETEKTITIEGSNRGIYTVIVGEFYPLPKRLNKIDYNNLFYTLAEAIQFLQERCNLRIKMLTNDLAEAKEWLSKLNEVAEK